ncbi:thiopurine S-methyltransferase [Alkalilimnicola ehrlichii]|uniref:Thiopurine S-methyltransferase n=1 Tax=Alkalilimnicola ehrlichii TaxID=351052 RepID=A0A3E0WJ89_9GAMM|nr:thiopurine S-methyltransferase [Alkalilimnicola ehrlichii]RFA25778.1 thiopurine S-methyltransferase [Alkalilimnicola ehrlichii]RFA32858.1 thiopurine S-methyltransferase [Alkalilimnicola ehrlichii]
MDKQFWLDKWHKGEIGFHEGQPNSLLEQHWSTLGVAAGSAVLVPLCGKAQDLRWLAEQGLRVIGIELAQTAIEAFFAEQGWVPERDEQGPYQRYRAGGVELYCGDIFDLPALALDEVGVVYDRAALIAFPPELRRSYAAMLQEALPELKQLFLITLEYPQAEMSGPPFSVAEDEIRTLYGAQFGIEQLAHAEPERRFRQTTLSYLTESAWWLKK